MRWSLRSMLLVMTGLCLLGSWFEHQRRIAHRERMVLEKWAALGDCVEIKCGPIELVQGPDGPWDRRDQPRRPTRWEAFEMQCFNSPHLSAILVKRPCRVDAELFACLPDAVHLKHLSIPWTEPTREHIEAIAGMYHLEGLELAKAAVVDDELLQSIVRLRDLRVLGVGGTNITDDGLRHITRLEKLEWLNIIDNTRVQGDGVVHLTSLPNLTQLSADWLRFSREAILTLDDCPKYDPPDVYGDLRKKRAAQAASSATTNVDKLDPQAVDTGDGHADEQGSQREPKAD